MGHWLPEVTKVSESGGPHPWLRVPRHLSSWVPSQCPGEVAGRGPGGLLAGTLRQKLTTPGPVPQGRASQPHRDSVQGTRRRKLGLWSGLG